MRKRSRQWLVTVLLLLQVVTGAPLAWALQSDGGTALSLPCALSQDSGNPSEACPDCADGSRSYLSCLSGCLQPLASPSHVVLATFDRLYAVSSFAPVTFLDRADPPLNPPPIA